jgi:hypothetical protein
MPRKDNKDIKPAGPMLECNSDREYQFFTMPAARSGFFDSNLTNGKAEEARRLTGA